MTVWRTTLGRALAVSITGLVFALGVAACGDDDGDKAADKSNGTSATGNAAEAAFLQTMVPHHESAIDMARIARDRGEHPEIKTLADAIDTTQATEIAQMKRIYERVFDRPFRSDGGAHDTLGLSAEQAGMAHMEMSGLDRANPFDKAFIDGMVPHHQGAIRMANAVMAKSDNVEIERLAESIIAAQAKEIREMNAWRTEWYGEPSPSGDAPAAGKHGAGSTEEDHGAAGDGSMEP